MQLFPCKEILSAIAIALTFIAFVPYIRAIIRGTIIPPVISAARTARQDYQNKSTPGRMFEVRRKYGYDETLQMISEW
jgi:flagellar biosynthesis protein FliP